MKGLQGNVVFLCLVAAAWSFFGLSCRADLILDLSFGNPTILLTDDEDLSFPDDGISLNRSLGFTGSYFGELVTTVDVSSNGNLNFSGNVDFLPVGGPSSVARISPLWDDYWLYQGSGAQVIEHKLANSIYAVTWQDVRLALAHDSPGLTFQVAWFNQAVQIESFQFQPNDIAFSYDIDMAQLSDLYAVSGLDSGSGSFVAFPGDILDPNDPNGNNDKPGFLDRDEARLVLPQIAGEFFLFRPDGNNNYIASRENLYGHSSIPEPSALWLLTISAPGFFAFRRLRRSKSQANSPSASGGSRI